MVKTLIKIPKGEGLSNYRVTLVDDIYDITGTRRLAFIQELLDSACSGLLVCGSMEFEKMTITNNNGYWTAVLEACEQ